MKQLIGLVLILVLGFFGYRYYQNQKSLPLVVGSSVPSSNLIVNQVSGKVLDLSNVLGANIENAFGSGKALLSDFTGGQSDPIINKALSNIQNEVKDLPKETVDKVKYEFCKDVVSEYENKSKN